jgi:hypothetical protein
MLHMRIAEVVKLLVVKIKNGSVGDNNARSVLAFISGSHHPFKRAPKGFNVAP